MVPSAPTAPTASTAPSPTTSLTVAPARPQPTTLQLRVHGEVDLATAPWLRSMLEEAVDVVAREAPPVPCPGGGEATGTEQSSVRPRVMVDLTGVGFCSAAGITVLEHAHRTAHRAGVGYVVLAGPVVRRLAELTGMVGRLPMTSEVPATAEPEASFPG